MTNPVDSPRFRRVIERARWLASGGDAVRTDHLLIALAEEEEDRINNPRVYKADGRDDGQRVPKTTSLTLSRLNALEEAIKALTMYQRPVAGPAISFPVQDDAHEVHWPKPIEPEEDEDGE